MFISDDKYTDKEYAYEVSFTNKCAALLSDIQYGETEAEDKILDYFTGINDPEPLREALRIWARGEGPNMANAIGSLIKAHFDNAYGKLLDRGL